MRKVETSSSNVTQNKNEELRQKSDRTPFVEKVKCEDNIPEVRTTMKLEKTVTFIKVSDSLRRI